MRPATESVKLSSSQSIITTGTHVIDRPTPFGNFIVKVTLWSVNRNIHPLTHKTTTPTELEGSFFNGYYACSLEIAHKALPCKWHIVYPGDLFSKLIELYLSWLESDTAQMPAVVYDDNVIYLKLTYCDVQPNTVKTKTNFTQRHLSMWNTNCYTILFMHTSPGTDRNTFAIAYFSI